MQLEAWLRRQPRGATAQLARECGVAWNTIRKLVLGKHRPSLDFAIAIERATGGAVTVQDLHAIPRNPEPRRKAKTRGRR